MDTHTSPQFRPAHSWKEQFSHPHRPPEVLEREIWFVVGSVLLSLVVVAFLANGDGAGSSHHHFVQWVLAGLFVAGSGMIGLIVMNAICGYTGFDEPLGAETPATAGNEASQDMLESSRQLDRQAEYYRRRVYRETQSALAERTPLPEVASVKLEARRAPLDSVDVSRTSAATGFNTHPAENVPEQSSSSGAANPHLRRRRPRR